MCWDVDYRTIPAPEVVQVSWTEVYLFVVHSQTSSHTEFAFSTKQTLLLPPSLYSGPASVMSCLVINASRGKAPQPLVLWSLEATVRSRGPMGTQYSSLSWVEACRVARFASSALCSCSSPTSALYRHRNNLMTYWFFWILGSNTHFLLPLRLCELYMSAAG